MTALVDMRPTADTKPMSYDTQASQRPTLARAGQESPEKESMSDNRVFTHLVDIGTAGAIRLTISQDSAVAQFEFLSPPEWRRQASLEVGRLVDLRRALDGAIVLMAGMAYRDKVEVESRKRCERIDRDCTAAGVATRAEAAPLTDAEIRDSRRITVGGTDLYNIWRALDLLDSLLDKPEVQKQVEHIGYYRDATAALACLHSLVASFRSAVSPENERPSHLHPADHMRQAEKHLAMALEHIRETEYKDAPSTQRLETMLDHIGDSIHALEMKHGGQANA